jgi:nitroreductase
MAAEKEIFLPFSETFRDEFYRLVHSRRSIRKFLKKEVDELLGVTKLPEYQSGHLELLCGLVIGHPDHEPPKAARQRENRVHWISE